ncbi:MAG: adenine deaminase [Bacteroidetes bacterium 4572_77]|nr:MAG: adenine deaminase [Bacteroidetes bacterium 4572_77]
MIFKGNIIDIIAKNIFKGEIHIQEGKIAQIIKNDKITETQYILPGLVDAHIHIESSMLIPSEFARLASVHGTVATVSDPHEIANVLGKQGVNYMIENGKKVPFKFFFGAPSCVPATPFETSGAQLNSSEVADLLSQKEIKYLSEMMNFPGVLNKDAEVMAKIAAAKKYGKPVDGHAPGLKGKDAQSYVNAGISTDHECFTIEEAIDKINSGMFVQIREGSAAKNYNSLAPLLKSHPAHIMLCSDDKHPNDLQKGHINQLIKRALADDYELMNILQACILNPIKHYDLEVGMLQKNDAADFIIIDNLKDFHILSTYVDGIQIAENGESKIASIKERSINKFFENPLSIKDIQVPAQDKKAQIIQAINGELITPKLQDHLLVKDDCFVSDIHADFLKIMVLNRYEKAKPAIGFIKGFGLKKGAIASSVAHDSHNIIAVGVSDADIVKAVNMVINEHGGVSCVYDNKAEILPLPIGGIMSDNVAEKVAEKYEQLDEFSKKELGSTLQAPYMTLSFMALLVIPELKLSDKGLFDGLTFSFTSLLK